LYGQVRFAQSFPEKKKKDSPKVEAARRVEKDGDGEQHDGTKASTGQKVLLRRSNRKDWIKLIYLNASAGQ
jgi:hypothetical protein